MYVGVSFLGVDVDWFEEEFDGDGELFSGEFVVAVFVADGEEFVEMFVIDGVALLHFVEDFPQDNLEFLGLEVAAVVVVVGIEDVVGHLHHVGLAHHIL
jgi:hypothetical protein